MSLPFLQNYLGLSTGLQTRQASSGTAGGWKELGRTTLGTNTKPITVSSLANKRYYMVLVHKIPSGLADGDFRFGNSSIDSGNNYSFRVSANGGADATSVTQSYISNSTATSDADDLFSVGYLSNYTTKEKLYTGISIGGQTAGAGNAPERTENTAKWANTSNVLDTIQIFENGAGGNFATGSEIVVLGYDPADTHTTNFWQELSSTTLTTTASTINSGTITAKKYLWIQAFIKQASPYTVDMHCNGDTGSNYAARYSGNGGADASGTYTKLAGNYSTIAGGFFLNTFVINNYANEKLAISHTCEVPTTGAGTAPGRIEWASKWANTSSQITSIDITKEVGTGDLQSGSILKVWGSN